MKIKVLEGTVNIQDRTYNPGEEIDVAVTMHDDADIHMTNDDMLEMSAKTEKDKIEVIATSSHCVIGIKMTEDVSLVRVFQPYTMVGQSDALMAFEKGQEMFLKSRGKGQVVVEIYGG